MEQEGGVRWRAAGYRWAPSLSFKFLSPLLAFEVFFSRCFLHFTSTTNPHSLSCGSTLLTLVICKWNAILSLTTLCCNSAAAAARRGLQQGFTEASTHPTVLIFKKAKWLSGWWANNVIGVCPTIVWHWEHRLWWQGNQEVAGYPVPPNSFGSVYRLAYSPIPVLAFSESFSNTRIGIRTTLMNF